MSKDKTSIALAGTEAVKQLRLQKLKNGLPFMINAPNLPKHQCYLEYPDGRIVLVVLKDNSRDFTPLRELSQTERDGIRSHYNFSVFHA